MATRDLYSVLGVSRKATQDEIKAAYRRLARKLHPDVNKEADAPAKFAEVQEAYDVLSDEEKRRMYDATGRIGSASDPGPQPRGTYSWANVAGGGGPAGGFEDLDDFSSMFDAFFSGRNEQPGAGPGSRHGSGRGRASRMRLDAEASISVDFVTAAKGGPITVSVSVSGQARTLDVRIPPATHDGAKLRLRGEGRASADVASGSAARGDLILSIRVEPHAYFRAGSSPTDPKASESHDLWFELPLTIDEAVFGASVEVPTLDGPVQLRVPPGSGSGKRLRLTGRGMARSRGEAGDLYAVTRIVVPSPADLSDEQADAIRSAGQASPPPRPWASAERGAADG